jgi:hypothetical protein
MIIKHPGVPHENLPGGSLLRLLILCWVAMFAACSDGSGLGFGTCPQTGEFANFGCAKVEGVVRDQAGTNRFDSPTHTTDATGAYSLEIHDYGFGSRHGPPAGSRADESSRIPAARFS